MKFWPLIKIIPIKTNFKFVSFAKYMAALSVIAVIGSLFMTLYPLTPPCGGLNCGVDFTGGSLIEVETSPRPVDLAATREALIAAGFNDVQVQNYGTSSDPQGREHAMIRFQTPADGSSEAAMSTARAAIQTALGEDIRFTRQEVVGPKVSGELFTGGVIALLVAIGLMLVYIWFRFEWQFGLGAVAGLFHDVILVFGLFAVTKMEFTLTGVAAILTVIGYSMNDTVVVFDRLRENLRKYKKMPLRDVIDLSINETLSRTIITGVTALMALTALALLGGESLFAFSVALIFGIIFGTYSSIYVGAPIILLWGVKRGEAADDDPEPIKLGMASKP
ncbi:protein translocase subunit SecF [Brevundimonas sp.]|uniref:protein translocase subunit SecF n=1 Tax=Brevundimonas sp. TaxID=1871086 RepID=UPI0025E75500|nr:protein translocase subunit SecF [Brevundimonas sp.]